VTTEAGCAISMMMSRQKAFTVCWDHENDVVFVVLAVKAGGMRVARPRQASGGESKEKNEMTKEEIEEYGSRCVHRANNEYIYSPRG